MGVPFNCLMMEALRAATLFHRKVKAFTTTCRVRRFNAFNLGESDGKIFYRVDENWL